MATAPNEKDTLRNGQLLANRPDSEINNQWIRDKIRFLSNYVRAQRIVGGVADADPIAPDFGLVDAGPTTGALTDIIVGQTLEMTAGRAAKRRFKITAVDIPNDEIETAVNLFDNGVRSGDRYIVIFSTPDSEDKSHSHDGIDSVNIVQPNLAGVFLFG